MIHQTNRILRVYTPSYIIPILIFFGAFLINLQPTLANNRAYEECLLKALENADDDTRVSKIKEACRVFLTPKKESQTSLIDGRMQKEARSNDNPFAIISHKQNYILPFAYNSSTNSDPYSLDWENLLETEIKFQISLKYRLFDDFIKGNGDLYVAYTTLSLWQAYNEGISSPFRETNYEPEAWLQFDTDWDLFGGLRNRMISIGASHQSNGRSGSLSRSWNRLYLNLLFERKNFVLTLKPWWRVPESQKDSPDDSTGDDNPDIDKYMGYGELGLLYKWRKNDFTLLLRNNLRTSENMGAIQLGWSFPLYKKLKGYLQYFNGYGETLIDYNASTNRIGVGLLLTDWL